MPSGSLEAVATRGLSLTLTCIYKNYCFCDYYMPITVLDLGIKLLSVEIGKYVDVGRHQIYS